MVAGRAYEYHSYANAALIEALQNEPAFDVIHCHLGSAQVPLAFNSRMPVVFTLHTVPTPDDLLTSAPSPRPSTWAYDKQRLPEKGAVDPGTAFS